MKIDAKDRPDMSIAKIFNLALIPTPAAEAAVPAIAPSERHWDAVLYDGQSVLIREIRPQDLELERQFIERLSPTSRRFRFLGTFLSPSDKLLRQLVVLDPMRDLALIALINDGDESREIGVARLSTESDHTCEFAVTVGDEWQHKGLGTLLMQHLICNANERGINSMHSIAAADNESMREFATHLGFKRTPDPDDATRVVHSLDLSARRARRLEASA
jgi:N-acetylglutamate synthase-like GNAT family acetyltransferase